MKCGHCFYWKSLNHKDDLTVDEIFKLADSLGRIENLNLSGGEPFMRREIAEICRYFVQNNGVEQIYIPTNAFFTKKIVRDIDSMLKEKDLKLLAIEISFDGREEFHNRLRCSENAFQKALETYDALSEIQKRDERLRIHAVSTVNTENLGEVRHLSSYLYERCPAMDHHNIALIRGDRKNPSLQGPELRTYEELYSYIQDIWRPREEGRFGSIVEPMLQWAKVVTAEKQQQLVPCMAGILSAVVYANGDVSFCETLDPVGNVREETFQRIWHSQKAEAMRQSIRNRECYCTNEIFLWPSIVFQPLHLFKTILGTKIQNGKRSGKR